MIPIKLELENFMPYRNPAPLDFGGIHIACLTGDNGAGKSSLLDAITWALWGKARAHRDDELIHLGQDEMRVEFTFEMEDRRYRVLRQRRAGKRGRTVLDLQVADAQGQFRTIAESSVRQTQRKLNALLRMDYETFVNSAFLLQGRADEFTVKTAGERKQVLADILGLDRWAVYEERAKARVKQADEQLALVKARLDEIERELAQEETYQADLSAAKDEALRLADALRQAEERLRDVQAARQELLHTQNQLADLSHRLAQREAELQGVAEEHRQARARLDGIEKVLAQADEIRAGYERWSQAREADATFNALLARQNTLLQQRAALEAQIAQARAELIARQSALNQQIVELKRQAAGVRVRDALERVRAELADLSAREAERDTLQARLTALREEAGERRARDEALKAQGNTLNERLEQLEHVAEPVCPLCGQELTDAHRAELVAQLEAERDALRQEWRENQARLQAVADETRQVRHQLEALTRQLKRLSSLQRREAELRQRVQDAEEAMARLDEVQADLALVNTQLDTDDYALPVRQQLGELEAQMEALGYDAEKHREAQATVQEAAPFEARHAQLQRAQEQVGEAREAVARLAERQARWERELAAEREQQARLQATIAALEDRLTDADQIEAQVAELRRQETRARERLGAAQQRLDACRALKEQKQTLLDEQNRLRGERAIFDELRVACGKKGVPAMIIEAAIPEIEDTANRLLARMTDGRMHVRFETQREKVTGGVAETLDIQISDELGTRNYELYSGGEAFRINFAIRIALSQLLARRAGARLRTLVIDEGFGTQDAQGRERLVEAIHAIQDEFDRIIVVTHIDELKDAFPAHIHVTKTPEGSQIEVL